MSPAVASAAAAVEGMAWQSGVLMLVLWVASLGIVLGYREVSRRQAGATLRSVGGDLGGAEKLTYLREAQRVPVWVTLTATATTPIAMAVVQAL